MNNDFHDETNEAPGKWKEWLEEKKKRGKMLKKDQLLIVLLSGVLLLVIAFPTGNKEKSNSIESEEQMMISEGSSTASPNSTSEEIAPENTYTEEMEKKLSQILSAMDQVGKVKVVITLKASGEKVVEKDNPVTRSNTEEQDSEGGTRSVNNVDSKETTIYETDSGKSTPYVVKTTSPQVEGVLVVCEGAGVGNVSKNITDAIEVLFGIEPHKIKVVKMKTS